MIIDNEFKGLIPPLTDEEYKGLEESILKDGCRDALVLWGEILVDGHNRYEICTRHNIPFKTVQMEFSDRDVAREWMIKNQLSRRNLKEYDIYKLAMEYKKILQNKARKKEIARKRLQQTEADERVKEWKEKVSKDYRLTGRCSSIVPNKPHNSIPDLVYFVIDCDRIKIGAATEVSLDSRIKDIKKHIPTAELIGTCYGGVAVEKKIHEMLKEEHLNNEWFRITTKSAAILKAFIPETDFSNIGKVRATEESAEAYGIKKSNLAKFEKIEQKAPEAVKKQLRTGEISINKAYNAIKLEEKKETIKQAEKQIAEQATDELKPILHIGDSTKFKPTEKYDLLLTDPPYSTDVDDIEKFVGNWLYNALDNVKDTGFAYIFIGAYPDELRAYLNAKIPQHMKLSQQLIWTYKNTLGNNPKDRYKQNYQSCLFYRGTNAPDLDCPLTAEQWAVQEINAPDGRQGDRYHAWQKPIEIAERFIRHSTKQGDTIFDPFACTGTFLLAAAKLGRKAYGFEINTDNAKIAFERGCIRG